MTVRPGMLRIGSIAFLARGRSLNVVLTAVDAARRPVSGTAVRARIRRNGRSYAVLRGRTGPAGKTVLSAPLASGCFTVVITRATAQGFVWNGRTPRNRVCRR